MKYIKQCTKDFIKQENSVIFKCLGQIFLRVTNDSSELLNFYFK